MAPTKLGWLAIAVNTAAVLAQTHLTSPYNGFSYLGCYSDSQADRALSNLGPTPDSAGMTIEKCIDQCAGTYSYIGLEYYYECWCANTLNPDSATETEADCSYACRGDSAEACGGSSRLSIYAVAGASSGGGGSGGGSGNTLNDPPIPQNIGSGYTYVNCYADTNSNRAVSGAAPATGYYPAISLEQCAANCASDPTFKYLGMDYYGECFCGPTLDTTQGVSSGCTLPCNANSSEACGGINAVQVYQRSTFNAGAAAAASRASVTSEKAASRSSVTSSKSAFSVVQAASRASVTSSKDAFSASRESSRASLSTSKQAFTDAQAASRASITSSRQAVSDAQAASRASVSTSKQLFSNAQAASRASVTSSRNAFSDGAAASRSSVTSSRSSASSLASSSRSLASSSRASANSALSSSRSSASSSRSSINSFASSSRASASASYATYAASVSSSKSVASSARAAAQASVSTSRSIANASLSSVRSAESSSRSAASAAKHSTMTTTTRA